MIINHQLAWCFTNLHHVLPPACRVYVKCWRSDTWGGWQGEQAPSGDHTGNWASMGSNKFSALYLAACPSNNEWARVFSQSHRIPGSRVIWTPVIDVWSLSILDCQVITGPRKHKCLWSRHSTLVFQLKRLGARHQQL